MVIRALAPDGGGWLASHPRARQRGTWVIDPAHWDGLPDGHTRATVLDPAPTGPALTPPSARSELTGPNPLAALLTRHHGATAAVATRPLSDYQNLIPTQGGDASTSARSPR